MTDIKAISSALVSARQTCAPLADYPGDIPPDLETAYAIQNCSIEAFGKAVAGWKVGGIPPQYQSKFQASRLAGPVFEGTIHHCEDGATVTLPVYEGGFAAVEAEYVLRYDAIPDADITPEEAKALVSAIHVGVEIASSPLAPVNDLGPTVTISDFGNNAGMIIGPEVDRTTDFSAHEVITVIDGEEVGRTPAAADGPWLAASFLLNHLRAHNFEMPDGLWITTGAITGVHSAPFTSNSTVTFSGLGTMHVSLHPFDK